MLNLNRIFINVFESEKFTDVETQSNLNHLISDDNSFNILRQNIMKQRLIDLKMINKRLRDEKRLRELKIENLILQKFITTFDLIITFVNVMLTNVNSKDIDDIIKLKTFKSNKMRFYKNQSEDEYIC